MLCDSAAECVRNEEDKRVPKTTPTGRERLLTIHAIAYPGPWGTCVEGPVGRRVPPVGEVRWGQPSGLQAPAVCRAQQAPADPPPAPPPSPLPITQPLPPLTRFTAKKRERGGKELPPSPHQTISPRPPSSALRSAALYVACFPAPSLPSCRPAGRHLAHPASCASTKIPNPLGHPLTTSPPP